MTCTKRIHRTIAMIQSNALVLKAGARSYAARRFRQAPESFPSAVGLSCLASIWRVNRL
jgi:hypothetical protein